VTDFAKLILDADTKGLKQGEKALKDLGQQSKATADDVDSTAYRMGESVGKLAKMGFLALGAAATAAAGAVFLAGRRALNTADEMTKTSQALNMNVEAFQRAAYAARTTGVETEKLGDIYKDVNDKVGEFLQTGGGELKDFFDNIAPRVGITADAFRGLNGADALQLYVSTLEKAGVNSQEMTFYLEAIADEASRLAPILTDGGTRFKALGDEAERLGIVIDEKTGKAAQEFNVNMGRLTGILDGVTMRITAEMLPSLISMQEWLIANQDAIVKVATATGAFIADLFRLGAAILDAARAVSGFFAPALEWLDRNLRGVTQAAQWAINPLKAIIDLNNIIRGQSASSKPFGAGVGAAVDTAWSMFKSAGEATTSVRGLGMAATSAGSALGKGLGGGAKAANDNIKPMRDQLESAMDTLRNFKREMRDSGLFSSAAVTGDATRQIRADDAPPEQDMAKLNYGLTELQTKMDGLKDKAKDTTASVRDSFRQMATDALSALDRLAGAIQGGNFLSILSGVLNFGLQLGGMGVFGKGVQANINASPRANGGNVSAGSPYIVGENRPELFVPDTNGRIMPQVPSGAARVVVEASPYFDVRVDGRIQTAAPVIADAGANVAQGRMNRTATRRVA